MKTSCVYTPTVKKPDGTEVSSKLYLDLTKHPDLKDNRPLINYIYAQYLSNGGTALNAQGIHKVDENGQHFMEDVLAFYKIPEILNTVNNPAEITKAKQKAGAIDSSNNVIYYEDGTEALQKVINFNSNKDNAFVASVWKDVNKYIITIAEKNANTHTAEGEAELQMQIYNLISQAFNSINLNLKELALKFSNIFNITSLTDTLSFLKALQKTNNKYLTKQQIELLLTVLPEDSSQLSRILTKWTTIEEASQNIYEIFQGSTSTTSETKSLIDKTLEEAKKFNNLNLNQLLKDITSDTETFKQNSEIFKVNEVLEQLKQEFNLDSKHLYTLEKEINTLFQAAGNAIFLLDKRIKRLEKKEGITEKSADLEELKNKLLTEIDEERYYQGLLLFLEEVTCYIKEIETSINNIPGVPGTKDYIAKEAALLLEAKNIINGYLPLLQQLSIATSFEREEGISEENLNIIMEKAKELREYVEVLNKNIKKAEIGTIISILSDWLGWGETLPDGRVIANVVQTIDDVSNLEYLYSVSRSSSPLLAALGTIVRDAQDQKVSYLIEYNNRIARATDKLKKAGIKDTKWMYDEEGRIINPYDWEKLEKEYNQIRKQLKKENLSNIDLKIALQQEFEQNLTQEVLVDAKTGRTERVPVFMKKENPLLKLSPAQLEYYEEMMQIKGELGTMFPNHARNHFLPPQVRSNSFWDSKNVKDFFKRFKDKFKELAKITEQDIDTLGATTLIDNEGQVSYIQTDSDINDHPIKDIPTFYVKKLKDSSKLVTDFSGALQHLAGSAINYQCLNKIQDTVTLIVEYMQTLQVEDTINGVSTISGVDSNKKFLIKKIFKNIKTVNTVNIAESYLERELYAEKLKNPGALTKILLNIIKYVGFKQLSTNILGGTSNLIAGEYQILLEALGAEHFNLKDYAWANTLLFGDITIKGLGKIMDYVTNNTNEITTLIGNFFDPMNKTEDSLGNKRYNGVFRNLFTYDYSGVTYDIGENIIYTTIMYAMLHNTKVFIDGKKTSLYNAFDKTLKEDGNAELKLKDNVHLAEKDEQGNIIKGASLTSLEDPYFISLRNKIKSVNQQAHGAMNTADRGIISQRLVGRVAMQFRQWMVETLSKRYRSLHWDGPSKQWTEGYWHTVLKFLGIEINNAIKFSWKSRLTLKKLDFIINSYNKELQERTLSEAAFNSLRQKALLAKTRKANLGRALAESATVLLLNILSAIIGNPKDIEEDNPFFRFVLYLIKRLTWEATALSPVGVPVEIFSFITKPPATINFIPDLIYPIVGLFTEDVTSKYERGTHKDKNKYLVKSSKALPVFKDYYKMEDLFNDDYEYWKDLVKPYTYGRKYY